MSDFIHELLSDSNQDFPSSRRLSMFLNPSLKNQWPEHSDVLSGRSFSTSQPIRGWGGSRSCDGCCRLIDLALLYASGCSVPRKLGSHNAEGSRGLSNTCRQRTPVWRTRLFKGQNQVLAFYDQLRLIRQ